MRVVYKTRDGLVSIVEESVPLGARFIVRAVPHRLLGFGEMAVSSETTEDRRTYDFEEYVYEGNTLNIKYAVYKER